jgi:VanZ family protein
MTFIFAMSSREQFPAPLGQSTYLLSIGAHLVLYGFLAILLLIAFGSDGPPTRNEQIAAIAGAIAYGISDEFHQSFVPGRDASIFDLGVNSIGAALAVMTFTYVRSILTTDGSR